MPSVANSKTVTLLAMLTLLLSSCGSEPAYVDSAPNILFVITDDQSWAHTSFAGARELQTPNFDRIARSGINFSRAYVSAPSCTASRSAILAGQHFWRLQQAALLWGQFDDSVVNYQRLLTDAGYHTGFTGKGWGPGRAIGSSPTGRPYNRLTLQPDSAQISPIDYAANFSEFLEDKPSDAPFSFWVSPFEPHRPYEGGVGIDSGIDPQAVEVPAFLPDNPTTRRDLADYYLEIQSQDAALGHILDLLEQQQLLENTLIVVTSDNGMPFPRAKSSNYEFGVRVPLAISWPAKINPSRELETIINLSDLAPTFLTAAGLDIPLAMTGRNLLPLLTDSEQQSTATGSYEHTVTGFERHILNAREENMTYPVRALHTRDYVYIRNFAPERWPAGDPPNYRDIDATSPTRDLVLDSPEFLALATAKRPQHELYDLNSDPYQLQNLAEQPDLTPVLLQLSNLLDQELAATEDPILNNIDSFSPYPYYGPITDSEAPAN